MAGQDDAGRHHDPFDFREPPAPLGGSGPSTPGPPTHSPFDFPDGERRPRRRGPGRMLRRWGRELRAAQLSSPGAVTVGLAVLVVLVLVVAAVVALL